MKKVTKIDGQKIYTQKELSKKDRKRLKRKGIESPDTSQMFRIVCGKDVYFFSTFLKMEAKAIFLESENKSFERHSPIR